MVIVVVIAHVALSYQTYPEAENMMSVADIGDRYRNPVEPNWRSACTRSHVPA